MTAIEEAHDIFTIFHDGTIASARLEKEQCDLSIDIQYLAEKVEKNFTQFRIRIHGLTNFRFSPWEGELINEFGRIATMDLGILSASVVGDKLEVVCTQDYHDLGFTGGTLKFGLSGIALYDEMEREISLDDLKTLSAEYWNSWNQKTTSPP